MKNTDSVVFRRLHYKLIIGIVLAFVLVFTVFIGAINYYISSVDCNEAYSLLSQIAEHGGRFPSSVRHELVKIDENELYGDRILAYPFMATKTDPKRFMFSNYFSSIVDSDFNLMNLMEDFAEGSEFNRTDALNNIKKSYLKSNKNNGFYKDYAWGVYPLENSKNLMLVIVDRSYDARFEERFSNVSVLVFLLGVIASFIIAWGIALWCVSPVRESYEKQKQFLADASHELKTPIAVIGANLDVLSRELPNNKWLEYISEENERMSLLVKDMLFLAQNDAHEFNRESTLIDFVHFVAVSILPFEGVIYESGKKLVTEFPSEEIQVEINTEYFRRAVIILLDNAIKNTEVGDEIKVSVGIEKKFCYVKVFNTGYGIKQSDLSKIFNRFYRSDSSRSRKTGGYGLGLSIAKTIVENYKGHITVNSEENHYAEFAIYIPLPHLPPLPQM